MDAGRTQKIAEVLKSVATLGRNVKQPAGAAVAPNVKKALTEATSRLPTSSGGWLTIGFYVLAGLLAIAVILLGVDQFITPIVQRVPGGKGYIPVPGTDTTQTAWKTYKEVRDIAVRPVDPEKPNMLTLENRSEYAITLDVYIADEYPQNLPANVNRNFFILGPLVESPKIRFSLDNSKNTIIITLFSGCQRSLVIDNVPIRKPFRIGLVMNGSVAEAYFNGKLVRTLPIGTPTTFPQNGDMLFAPSSVKFREQNTANGIKVLNLTAFGYAPKPEELQARMTSLPSASAFS